MSNIKRNISPSHHSLPGIHCILLQGYVMWLVSINPLMGQADSAQWNKESYKQPILSETEISFLYSYYEQDGHHSPVLGGTGTEFLTDHVGKITVNIPIQSSTWSFMAGIDHYTSASTDNINPSSISSASVVDDRIYFSTAYSRENEKSGFSYGMHAGYSTEWDVTSYSGGFFVAKSFNEKNSQLQFNMQHYSDRWSLIFPAELRHRWPLDSTDWRHVYDATLLFSQVINKRLQGSISAELIYQHGYLSTPFHRVYFKDAFWPGVEQLPNLRLKIPFGIRLHYYLSDFIIARSYYRFYTDNFGIQSHTAHIEYSIKPSPFLALIPFYRFHSQTASKYFGEIDSHLSSSLYYTSDYDLSAFTSHKYGLGLRYAPVHGIIRTHLFTKNKIIWKGIEARGAVYRRSDGLRAWIVSLGISLTLNHTP